MNESIRLLQPTSLWNHFADLNAVPRASKKEQRVIAFMKSFGEQLALPTTVDEAGNVIIKKAATAGMEDRQTVVLQSHLDMVHQKNASTVFDFDTHGIDMQVDGDWVNAKGTTLGADNGIGVAAIMTLLASSDIPHPALEALFTIDEETGMTGALSLKGGLLDGRIMLNLDTEEDHELTIGCAGGIDISMRGQYRTDASTLPSAFKLAVTGLTGGHSGIDIHKGRANANKVMNRLLFNLSKKQDIEIARIEGGSLRNAIPRESQVVLLCKDEAALKQLVRDFEQTVQHEYKSTDPNLSISLEAIARPEQIMDHEFVFKLLRAVYTCPNGIYRMSPDIDGLVQTSNNLARIAVGEGHYEVLCLTRSSIDSEKMDLVDAVSSCFELVGATISCGGAYPGWTPQPDSAIVKLMSDLYRELFQSEPLVNACHAGLECGILGRNYPGMQMISFGPTIHGAHSPDEKVKISSVQKFWSYLLETLKRIPNR